MPATMEADLERRLDRIGRRQRYTLLLLVGEVRPDVGVHPSAGVERVGVGSVVLALEGGHAREPLQTPLRTDVRPSLRDGPATEPRGDVQDVAPLLLDHVGERRPGEQERALEIETEDGVPLRLVGRGACASPASPGSSPPRPGKSEISDGLHDPLDRVGVAHVGGDDERPRPRLAPVTRTTSPSSAGMADPAVRGVMEARRPPLG